MSLLGMTGSEWVSRHTEFFPGPNKLRFRNIIGGIQDLIKADMFNALDDLRIFIQIYEKKSLTVVAELNQTSPGAISKRLTQLEKDFGARLFHRSTRSIHPTEEGQRLYVQSQH